MWFGFMLQIVNINMSRNFSAVFIRFYNFVTIDNQNVTIKNCLSACYLEQKIDILWRRGISDEEEELAMKKRDHVMKESNKIARNRKCTAA